MPKPEVFDQANYAAYKESSAAHINPEDISSFVRAGVLAANADNRQPWAFNIVNNYLSLFPDLQRAKNFTDPTQRELYITLGCAEANIAIAAKQTGRTVERTTTYNPEAQTTAIQMKFEGEYTPTNEDRELFDAIPKRRSNRNPHEAREIPDEMKDFINRICQEHGISISLLEAKETRQQVAELMHKGDMKILTDNEFVAKLANNLRPNDTEDTEGMPGFALGLTDVQSIFAADIIRSKALAETMAKDDMNKISEQTVCVCVVSTDTDDPDSWIKTGNAFQQIALKATSLGMAANMLQVLVETDELRPDLQQLTRSDKKPQIMFRLGYPTKEAHPTPRRRAHEVMEVGHDTEKAPIQTDAPRIFSLTEGVYELKDLKKELGEDVKIHDKYNRWLIEQFIIRNPHIQSMSEEVLNDMERYVTEKDTHYEGKWIYFPWLKELVHVPNEDDFYEIMYSRNYPAMSREEQQALGELHVAVAGLSVGRNIALAAAMTGVKHLKIADFDTINPSNLNRMGGVPVTEVSESKTKSAAHALYEFNPYLDLVQYSEGLHEGNLEEFAADRHVLIDHMEAFKFKNKIRDLAKEQEKIVLMATDVGVEPIFDIELPTDPKFGGRTDEETIAALAAGPKDKTEATRMVVDVIGIDNTPAVTLENFINFKRKKQNYWSQLGLTGYAAAAQLSQYLREIARGDAEKMPKFHVLKLSTNGSGEKEQEMRDIFIKEFDYKNGK